MKATSGRWIKAGAALIAAAGFLAGVHSATAQATQTIDSRELIQRLQRLERDMRDLQAETFRKAPGDRTAPPAATANATPTPPPQPESQAAIPDLNPILRQIGDLEEGLGRLTGQMEELGHQVDQLSQKTDRLQKQMDFQAEQARTGASATPAQPGGDAGNELASINPDAAAPTLRGAPPANLGQIPAGTPVPAPANRPTDAKRQFDEAMNLLSRAQYDKAKDAFRAFADAHPDEDRAPDALYWTGDIAYSAKKDYPEAARDFAELLKKYPKAQRAPEGMLKLGLALFELGQMKEGCAALVALPAKYPDAAPTVATRARTERTNNKCR
ncbi:MAG TPA: tol-pal system protein YbgF [Micropepsaceae bacterium]|nr:tol-pal system protein YbgF [Micropepsaceae bacterium]